MKKFMVIALQVSKNGYPSMPLQIVKAEDVRDALDIFRQERKKAWGITEDQIKDYLIFSEEDFSRLMTEQ